MDIRKRVATKRQSLRIRIENYKITEKLVRKTLDFKAAKRITHDIDRAKAELNMLERRWKF